MSGSTKIPNADIIGYDGPVGHEKAIRQTHWHQTHGRKFKVTKDNGYVWVWKNNRQVRMKREEADREGYEIIPHVRNA